MESPAEPIETAPDCCARRATANYVRFVLMFSSPLSLNVAASKRVRAKTR